jgi:hypothetical protein
MRLIKMLGLAVTAIAAMAFLGAGTASATLCKAKESPCPAANQYPEHTTIVFSSKGVLLNPMASAARGSNAHRKPRCYTK